MTHRFIYKCQIRVWTLFCDKKKVTEVFLGENMTFRSMAEEKGVKDLSQKVGSG